MDGDIRTVLLDEETIKKKVQELAAQITREYRDKDLLLICILKGGFIFMSDLARQIQIPLNLDFMAISSYGLGTPDLKRFR